MSLERIYALFAVAWICIGMSFAQVPEEISSRMPGSETSAETDLLIYQKLLSTSQNPIYMEGMADCYLWMGEPELAEQWYRKSLAEGNPNADILLKFAWVLQSNNKFSEALAVGKEFERLSGDEVLSGGLLQPSRFAQSGSWANGKYIVKPLKSVNTHRSDVVAFCDWDHFYFYSQSSRREIVKGKNKKKQRRVYSLYSAQNQEEDYKRDVQVNARNIGTRPESLGMSQTLDSKNYLQTKPVLIGVKPGTGNAEGPGITLGIKQLRIGEKGEIEEGYLFHAENSDDPSFHPAIDPHGQFIVFASTRAGGYGNADLYVSFHDGNGWSEPQNLGPSINTSGNEYFPSLDGAGSLYFASDGLPGFGGLDIFGAKREGRGWGDPANLGNEINSMFDDFGMVWEPAGRGNTGYFSSNRHPISDDDIYWFKVRPEVRGMVRDTFENRPVEGASVVFVDMSGGKRSEVTGADGLASNFVDFNRQYKVEISAYGYISKDTIISTEKMKQGDDMRFEVILEKQSRYYLYIAPRDANTGLPMDSARVSIHDLTARRVLENKALIGRAQEYRLKTGRDYAILVQKPGYLSQVAYKHVLAKRGHQNDSLRLALKPGQEFLIEGMVTGSGMDVDHLIKPGKVSVVDSLTEEVLDSAETFQGRFLLALDRQNLSRVSVFTAAEGYLTHRMAVELPRSKDSHSMEISLEKAQYGLGNLVTTILYPYGTSKLELVSRQELARIYYFLDQNEGAKLSVRSHTDSRGSADYNYQLSRRRSKAVVDFIRAHRPVPEYKFSTEDFGEFYLLNDCKDGVPCTEEEHEKNRRTELYFLLETPLAADEL